MAIWTNEEAMRGAMHYAVLKHASAQDITRVTQILKDGGQLAEVDYLLADAISSQLKLPAVLSITSI